MGKETRSLVSLSLKYWASSGRSVQTAVNSRLLRREEAEIKATGTEMIK